MINEPDNNIITLPIKQIDCVQEICRSQGDINATCNDPENGFDRCKCTASEKFYLSPSSGCLKLPPPIDCEAYNAIDEDLDLNVVDILWSKQDGALYTAGTYFEVQYGDITIKSSAYQTYQQGNIPGTTEVTVRAVFDDPVNGLVYSDTTQLQMYTDVALPHSANIL